MKSSPWGTLLAAVALLSTFSAAAMSLPGDGKVTKSSLLGRLEPDVTTLPNEYPSAEFDHPFFFCELHDVLTGNVHLIDNLLHYLLSVDRPAPAAH